MLKMNCRLSLPRTDLCHLPQRSNGGPGAEAGGWADCTLGHDCSDCGPRYIYPPMPPKAPPPSTPPGMVITCENDCYSPQPQHYDYASNGMCNDGGEGSETFGWGERNLAMPLRPFCNEARSWVG